MARRRRSTPGEGGFTLVEFVIVIVVIGIVASLLANILRRPMEGYIAVERRAALVDRADTALLRMTREMRLALPYSVRLSGSNAVEFLRTFDGGRYKERGAGRLNFNVNTATFEVTNALANPGLIRTGSGSAACMAGSADCLVVYNIGQPKTIAAAAGAGISANAYLGASLAYEGNVATIAAAAANSLTFDNSDLIPPPPPPWSLGVPSPDQRFHIVDTPVSFICAGGSIYRYSGYGLQENQPVPPAVAGDLLVDGVSQCTFDYQPPTVSRFGLVTLQITVTSAGESVSLTQQIHVSNIP